MSKIKKTYPQYKSDYLNTFVYSVLFMLMSMSFNIRNLEDKFPSNSLFNIGKIAIIVGLILVIIYLVLSMSKVIGNSNNKTKTRNTKLIVFSLINFLFALSNLVLMYISFDNDGNNTLIALGLINTACIFVFAIIVFASWLRIKPISDTIDSDRNSSTDAV